MSKQNIAPCGFRFKDGEQCELPLGHGTKIDEPVREILNNFCLPDPRVSVGTNDRICIAVRVAFQAGVHAADREWEEKLGPLLVHNGCDCDEETEAEDFELCFAHRVQDVINGRKR